MLPRLYPILDVHTLFLRDLNVEQVAQELVEGGAEILQLRNKRGTPQEILQQAEVISRTLAGTGCLPVMNDRVDLAVLAGWTAVHLGNQDLPPEAARRMLAGRPLTIGVSTHNEAQVRVANSGSAEYVAIGPVFSTVTKADAEPVVGLEGVRRARALTRKPLVAIGGITRENAAAVIGAGADSVAVISSLFAEGERVSAVVQDFLRRLR